jgi:hypothetical protein
MGRRSYRRHENREAGCLLLILAIAIVVGFILLAVHYHGVS